MNFHAANQGSTSMLARARDDVYWPNMDNDINNHVSTCSQCRESAPSQQKEPLLMTEAPEYPFQHTVADLFQVEGHWYMVYADRLTGYPELAHYPSTTTSRTLISSFREFFIDGVCLKKSH